MQIIKIKMADIVPYENNVKLHPKEQIEQIKKSIVDFGNKTRTKDFQKKCIQSAILGIKTLVTN